MTRAAPLLALLLVACPRPPETDPDPDSDSDSDSDTLLPCDQRDEDEDGYDACVDCDDHAARVYPGARERCDGKDNDCAGGPHPDEVDADSDGVLDCQACADGGYWEATRDLSGAALEAAVLGEMGDLRCGYREAGDYLFLRLDNHDGLVECVYTGRTTQVSGTRPDSTNDMNVEHSWPQSQGADDPPPECDLHHLYPSDVQANQRRANHPFGEVVRNVDWAVGGSSLGDDASGDLVFEPRDVHKGNVARSMLYMSLRYDWSLPRDQVDLFLAWHAADPVDATELARTLEIADFQAFANPLVTCPDLPERLWSR